MRHNFFPNQECNLYVDVTANAVLAPFMGKLAIVMSARESETVCYISLCGCQPTTHTTTVWSINNEI